MNCPNCGFEQPESQEFGRCHPYAYGDGII